MPPSPDSFTASQSVRVRMNNWNTCAKPLGSLGVVTKVDLCCGSEAKDMRPSSIMTFEPSLEHGVPWGRDLFTFVTSAAGHMMRTLQRPRKNKPSKRQVNHRRFLHNMIHRKFAEIEAANHQLASAIFSTDKSLIRAKPSHNVTDELTDQSDEHSEKAIDTSINADKTEVLVEQQEDEVCDLWTLDNLMETQVTDRGFLQLKPLNNRATNSEKVLKNRNQMGINLESSMGNETELSFERQQVSTDLESLTQMTSSLLEDSVSNWFGSIERMRMNSKPFITKSSGHTGNDIPDLSPPSPVISLLSLDSCDLEIQMLIDADQTQDGPVAESLQMDMIDSFDLLYCSDNQEDQHCIQNNSISSLDSSYDTDNLTGFADGSSTQEFEYDSQIMTMLGNSMSNLDQKSQELSLNQDRRIFHQSPVNYSMSQNNVPDHFRQLAPCMMTNRKEAGYLATTLSVSNQTVSDCIGSSHHTFPEMDCQSKQIPFNNWEQRSGESTYKNYSQGLETPQHLIMHDTNIGNVEKNNIENDNRTGSSGFQCSIMDSSWFEGFDYDKRESCSYSKFRGNQSTHNFEGVALSFPAKVHKTHPNPIPTPPLDDDWLFSNIVA